MPFMRITCNGNHRLFSPIRPIALTCCDALATARRSKFWAVGLVLAVPALLFVSHLSAEQIEALTGKLIRAVVSKYVSGLTTDWVYTAFLHWALANGAFFMFRLGAFFVLYTAYELGRDIVFALLCLATICLALQLAAAYAGAGTDRGVSLEKTASIMLGSVSVLAWYWSRYCSPTNPNRKIFDHEVGAAMTRLRHR
jgi:hypothetical protein